MLGHPEPNSAELRVLSQAYCSQGIAMAPNSLDTYNEKRDFTRTSEPQGVIAAGEGRRFIVQKHEATRLHYDLRLELDGVLLSWAVTRGPSLDPAEKRLAVRTEDHPTSYAEFEGTIPDGSYGAGTVMLWDRGTWVPHGDPHEGLRTGKLRFDLHGERMRGAWMLIRMRGAKRENWLLRKIADAEAGTAETLTKNSTSGIKTGRSMEAIAGRRRTEKKPCLASGRCSLQPWSVRRRQAKIGSMRPSTTATAAFS
jgi:bifunctional non-homologous end joining protein LigD